MKRLYLFSIRSFTGPFIVTFCISMFMLIMQFLWKYIDDLIGKGIEFSIIMELFVYVSASLIPLALPLAMLLSSIMTMGNLAENNELTALKSAGLSLFKILRPLTTIVLFIGFGTFLFSNFVIPVANLKWHALIYDIQETKIATLLTPGTYSTVLDGYAIKIKEGNDDQFKEITIHDHTTPGMVKTVKAKDGRVYKEKSGKYLFFKLKQGEIFEELSPIPNQNYNQGGGFYPSRSSSFEEASYKIELSGFQLKKTDEDLFKNEYEMWNVFQINEALDSIQTNSMKIRYNFLKSLKMDHIYYQSMLGKTSKDTGSTRVPDNIAFENIHKEHLKAAYSGVMSKIRRVNQNLKAQSEFMSSYQMSLNKFEIEFHKKFALAFAVVVLFFVGAPLGAIVKKGGFGAPVVIAALLFMLYYVLNEIGLNLADSGVTSPFLGIWLASFILSPIALILMRAAATDSKVFDKEFWKRMLIRKKK